MNGCALRLVGVAGPGGKEESSGVDVMAHGGVAQPWKRENLDAMVSDRANSGGVHGICAKKLAMWTSMVGASSTR